MRLFISRFPFLLALLILPLPTHAQQTFQLLTPTTGWYRLDHRLFYTTDSGAHWSDISPVPNGRNNPGNFGTIAVHFRDPRTAWALIVTYTDPPPNCDESYSFDIASTTDAGAHWSRRIIPIPPKTHKGFHVCPSFSGQGEIFFLDSHHGWVNLRDGSPSFPTSDLLYTTDAGITWHETEKNDRYDENGCGLGPLVFTTPQDAWGLPQDDGQLCVTHDGGVNFTEASLNPPAAGSVRRTDPVHSIPSFEDNLHGFVVAVHEESSAGNKNDDYALILYETLDGGRTWHPSGALTGLDFHVGFEALAVSHSTWIFTEKSSNPTGFILHELPI